MSELGLSEGLSEGLRRAWTRPRGLHRGMARSIPSSARAFNNAAQQRRTGQPRRAAFGPFCSSPAPLLGCEVRVCGVKSSDLGPRTGSQERSKGREAPWGFVLGSRLLGRCGLGCLCLAWEAAGGAADLAVSGRSKAPRLDTKPFRFLFLEGMNRMRTKKSPRDAPPRPPTPQAHAGHPHPRPRTQAPTD